MLGSAADVEEIVRAHGHDHADYVLSGLPFSTLPEGVGPAIAAATHRVLRPGGAFLVYQFSAAARDFMARHFARIDTGLRLAQRAAVPAVLGLEGLTSSAASGELLERLR